MPRSSLLNALMRIAADVDRARRPAGPVDWGPKIERRAVLRGAASLAGMALLPRLPALAAAEARVAIVGAGLAGLTAAYELSKVGLRSDVYESSTRLGGRCYSIKFSDGQVAEHGGEFINKGGQRTIQDLASELHLELDDTYNEHDGWDERWRFGDETYTRAQATTDYAKLHPVIQYQHEQIDRDKDFAKDLDQMSLAEWSETYVCGGRASKLGQLIENALTEECAADATELSGLVPAQQFWLNQIPVQPPPSGYTEEFQLYYSVSNERLHIRGGNDQIPFLLGNKLGDAVKTGTTLIAVTSRDKRVRLSLSRDCQVFEEDYDRVILALPFTTLRQVDIEEAGFQKRKRLAIDTLGMGASTKFQLRFKNRDVWNNKITKCSGEIRLNSNWFQTTWDVTGANRHDRGAGGMLCFWSGGSQAERAGTLEPHDLAKRCLADAEKVLPCHSDGTCLSDLWTGEMIRYAWRTNPWSLGSYSYLPIGYATTLFGVEKEREGNCFFAGEHTADKAEDCGYLNTAVWTGQRAAREVLNSFF